MRFFLLLSQLPSLLAVTSVIIGDSLFWSGALFFGGQPSPLVEWLESRSGHTIPDHAQVGASLGDGWVKSIKSQYGDLSHLYPEGINTLIMDGGGNDVLSHRNDCEQFNDFCISTLNRALEIASSILDEASQDGVQNIIYLGFYSIHGLERAVDYGNTAIGNLCATAPLSCFFVDPRYNETSGAGLATPLMLGPDGIHPNGEGYKILADMIWEVSLTNGIQI